MLKKLETSKTVGILLYCAIFVVILICNVLTPYSVDDFSYYFSFATKEPLENIWQIFPSMAAHAQTMNGRLTAHFLVQLFMLVPKWVFDIVNSGMFCLQLLLISKLSFSKKRSNLCTAALFCGIWLWELAFGQVNFWQDGAINYLWSGTFIFLFLWPFANCFLNETKFFRNIFAKIGFLLFSFAVGSYSETASAAAVFLAFVLVILDAVCNHRPLSRYGLSCVAVAVVGYVSIYFAPAQWMNKRSALSAFTLIRSFENATQMYASFGILAAAFVVLLVVNVSRNTPVKRILLALVFVVSSLAANYIMIFAAYYPERSSVAALLLLITGVAILLPPVLEDKQWKTLAVSTMAVLVLSTVPSFVSGIIDVSITYVRMTENEARIQESIANGESNAYLRMIFPETKYSAIYDAKYLDLEDNTSWPNNAMARYYGIDTVTGVAILP